MKFELNVQVQILYCNYFMVRFSKNFAVVGVPAGAPTNREDSLQYNFLAAAVAEGEMELTWDSVNGAKSYLVQFSTEPGGAANWSLAMACTKSKATIKNLESGKKYWFKVAALGSAGQGPWSDPATKYSI
jgi:Fibronectin type III domain